MEQLRWWEKDTAIKAHESRERLMIFEESLFKAFSSELPPKEMPLVFNKIWLENQWVSYECRNDDANTVIDVFNWLPWTQLIGFRLRCIIDNLSFYPSIDALLYYAPAFMLHWLYFRHDQTSVDFDIENLFIPPDDQIIFEGFGGVEFDIGEENPAQVKRFYAFRDGMTLEQKAVCREFCTLWVPWKYRDIDFSLVEEAYVRLLSYWE